MTVFWSTLTFGLVVLVVVGLISLVLGHLAAWRHFRRPPTAPMPEPLPGVTLLKPVEGAGPRTEAALSSFCRLEYGGPVELLIGTLREDDPIVPIVDRLRREHPDRSIRLVLAKPFGSNRKTSIMEVLWREAAHEYLFFSDSDVVASPDYLTSLVPLLAQPGVGCLTCLPRGIQARSLGARLIALHYDFNYLPQWMLALRTTGINWAIGHTMAVPKRVLEQLGGFREFRDQLADDYELGHRTAGLGLRVELPAVLLDCVMVAESVPGAWRRHLRWKRTMRRARGVSFAGIGLTYPVFWAFMLALIQPFSGWAWAVLAGTIALRFLFAFWLQSWVRMPDWARSWWLLPLMDVLDGLSFLGAYTGRTIVWAGRRYRLLPDGRLAAWVDDKSR